MFRLVFIIAMFTLPVYGAVLHIGENYTIAASEYKTTSPSLAMRDASGKKYYIPLGSDCTGRVNVRMQDGTIFKTCEIKRLEYLESTGTQCIDTGIIPTGTTSFELKTYIADTVATDAGHVPLGTRQNIDNLEWYYQISTFNLFPGGYVGYGPQVTIDANLAFQDINTVSFVSGRYTINKNYSHTFDIFEFPAEFTNTLYMFCLNSKGSEVPAPDYFIGKIYYVKIWDNGKLLRDYIPVLDSDGVPAMLDLVSGKFFYNIGSGQFKYSI